ncbi:APC family permease [Mycobacterium hackensackense]|uniref:APC family permease n=1 Tax=Mycobacterium hackensackense TaxID=228909 RepID=UPI002265C8B1|nr:APC family permease [Mycobacterium hackensackense]MCV7255812.1 APC family permease [Mycobacterium hackensackense]
MTPSPPPGQHSLKSDSIGVVGAVFMCMAFMGPAISVAYNTPAAAAGAGFALPLSILLALISCLLVANNIAAFARKLPSAGFAYTYNSHGFGPRAGFLSGWAMLTAYGMVGPMIIAAFGGFSSTFIDSVFHVHVPWQLLSTFLAVFIWVVLAAGISESVRVAFVFLAIEVGVILALAITILAKGGADGLSLQNFNPAHSLHGFSGIGTGMLWGILMFIGFEAAATLGEEAKGSRRAIPAALFTAVIAIGGFYVIAAYGSSSGFGLSGVADFAADTDPWATLAQKFWGGTAILTLTIIASATANGIAGSNSAVRILFSMGREGILPSALGRTSGNGVPRVAVTAYVVFSLAFALLVGVKYGPFGVWGFCGTLLGLAMVAIYIAVSIAVIPFYLRRHRAEFSVLRHAVIPVISVLIMLLPIYGQLHPLPAYPNNVAVYFIPIWMLIGVGYLVYLQRRHPHRIAAMGRVFERPEADQPESTSEAA